MLKMGTPKRLKRRKLCFEIGTQFFSLHVFTESQDLAQGFYLPKVG